MRIKIFTPNENGKIELTLEELQQLLNEAYEQGWNDKPYSYGSLGGINYAHNTDSTHTSILQAK